MRDAEYYLAQANFYGELAESMKRSDYRSMAEKHLAEQAGKAAKPLSMVIEFPARTRIWSMWRLMCWLRKEKTCEPNHRVFLEHARKLSSHDQLSPQHGVWLIYAPNCAV
jgi:hypothetical protein